MTNKIRLSILVLMIILALATIPTQAATSYATKVLAIASDNLLFYWPLSETGGTVATDLKSGANGAYTSTTLAAISDPGGVGNAPYFDGIAAHVKLNSASFTSVSSYRDIGTLSFWIRTSAYPVGNAYPFRITNATGSPNTYVLELRMTPTNFLFRRAGGNGTMTGGNWAHSSVSGWQHLAMTWTVAGNLITVYQNGTQVTTATSIVAAGTSVLNTGQSNLGAEVNSPFSGGYTGYIAHVAIWNTVLTQSQIQQLADPAGLTPTATAPSVSAYSTLESSGQAVRFDYTGSFGEIAIVVVLLVIVGLISIFGMLSLTQKRS